MLINIDDEKLARAALNVAIAGVDLATDAFKAWFHELGYDRLAFSEAEVVLMQILIVKELEGGLDELVKLIKTEAVSDESNS